MNELQQFGEEVKARIKEMGKTPTEVAKMANVAICTVYKLINGKEWISLRNYIKIKKVLENGN